MTASWLGCECMDDEGADVVVVGRPVALSGRATSSTKAADAFVAALIAELGPDAVISLDERLTTVAAQRSLSEAGHRVKAHRERVDSAAATVLLQGYLDGRRAT
jgi:putative holliday junction resolvase